MTDNTATHHEEKTDDSGYTASLLSPRITEFEFQECKTEPCLSRSNSTENLSTLDEESSPLYIPLPVIRIRDPVIKLERCDKIWKTLQLIKTMQIDKPEDDQNEEGEEEEKEEEEEEDEEEEDEEEEEEKKKEEEKKEDVRKQVQELVKPSALYVKHKSILKQNNTIPLPFKFSVQRTRKVYPCATCNKQYLEKRSLRNHSERVHGIVIPLQRRRNFKKSVETKQIEKKVYKETSPMILPNKKTNNIINEKLNDKNTLVKIGRNYNNDNNNDDKLLTKVYATSKYVKCILCKRKVKSVKEHLIHYHKIGASTNIVKLESSLLNADKPSSSKNITGITPGNKKTTLKDILSGKPPQKSVNENTRNESDVMNNGRNINQESQVNRKRKYTSLYVTENKKLKLNNERYVSVQKRKKSINLISYKCDICLGTYASAHGLYKHKRVHLLRGETKENFHKFQCRYLNSPLNKKRLLNAAAKKNAKASDVHENLRLNKTAYRIKQNKTIPMSHTPRYNKNINGAKLTCLCGKLFRYAHTLFIHKKKCELYTKRNKMTEDAAKLGNDKDSGINITIKKREDGYEIVGKDEVDEVDEDEDDEVGEEEKPQNSIHFKDDSSLLNVSENVSKTATIVTKENVLDTSKYSKDHSILKLQIADEDEIIDIEEDLQINSNKSNEAKQSTPQKKDKVNCSLVRQNSNVSNMESVNNPQKVSTLKQMCEKILNDFQTCTNASATNDKHQEICREKKNRLIDQENIQNISQKVNYKNKRELRSSNRRQKNLSEEFEYSYGEACTTESDLLLVCGYCHEQFGTNTSYNNHQCTVEEGKSFDEFSLQLLCFYCNETLSNYADFDQHVRLEHFDALFHCYQCTERFDSDRARLKHFYAEHNDMRCRFCNKKLSISLKVLHEGYHLGFGYPCHKCKKAYSNKKNLSYHKYTRHPHGADNLVTCTLCLKQIKVKTFRGHMATHKDNACHFCGKVFSNRTGIEYHTMIYHGTNSKLKCNVCDARFMNKKLLEKHEKMDGCNSDARKKESAAIYGKSH